MRWIYNWFVQDYYSGEMIRLSVSNLETLENIWIKHMRRKLMQSIKEVEVKILKQWMSLKESNKVMNCLQKQHDYTIFQWEAIKN